MTTVRRSGREGPSRRASMRLTSTSPDAGSPQFNLLQLEGGVLRFDYPSFDPHYVTSMRVVS